MNQYRSKKRSIYLGPELDTAVNTHLSETGTEFNTLVRVAVAKEIGQPELAESVKMGRPSTGTEAPPPVKKKQAASAAKSVTPAVTPNKKRREKPTK